LPLPAAGCPTDERSLKAIFSYKHAAQRVALGTVGRHSLVITPEFGPRVRLACLLTEAPSDTCLLTTKEYCIDCDACIHESPAQALQVPRLGEITL
jgi:epoxyqueuosine reductase